MPTSVLKKSHSRIAVDSAMGFAFKGRKSRQRFSELARGLRAGMQWARPSDQLALSLYWWHVALPKEPSALGGGVIEQTCDY